MAANVAAPLEQIKNKKFANPGPRNLPLHELVPA